MPISFNGTTGAVTGIVSASSSDLSTSLSSKVSTTGQTGTVNLSTATIIGSGLDLVASQTFTAASTVSINNCFTNLYQNYTIHFSVSAAAPSGNIEFSFRVRSGGSDLSSSTYISQMMQSTSTSQNASASTSDNVQFGYSSNTYQQRSINTFEIRSPQLSSITMVEYRSGFTLDSGSAYVRVGQAVVNNTNQYDGFTIYATSGNFTGNVKVYGYRNT
jgi:hypothetical protein